MHFFCIRPCLDECGWKWHLVLKPAMTLGTMRNENARHSRSEKFYPPIHLFENFRVDEFMKLICSWIITWIFHCTKQFVRLIFVVVRVWQWEESNNCTIQTCTTHACPTTIYFPALFCEATWFYKVICSKNKNLQGMLLCMILVYCVCKLTHQDGPLAVYPGYPLALEAQWTKEWELQEE